MGSNDVGRAGLAQQRAHVVRLVGAKRLDLAAAQESP